MIFIFGQYYSEQKGFHSKPVQPIFEQTPVVGYPVGSGIVGNVSQVVFSRPANNASLLIFIYFAIDVYLKCNTEYIGFVITRLNKYYLNSGKYDQNAYIFVGIELFSYIFGVVLTLTGYHRRGSKVLFAMSTASTLLTYDVYQSGKFQSSGVLQVSKHFAISGGVLLLAAFLSQAGHLNSLKGKLKR